MAILHPHTPLETSVRGLPSVIDPLATSSSLLGRLEDKFLGLNVVVPTIQVAEIRHSEFLGWNIRLVDVAMGCGSQVYLAILSSAYDIRS